MSLSPTHSLSHSPTSHYLSLSLSLPHSHSPTPPSLPPLSFTHSLPLPPYMEEEKSIFQLSLIKKPQAPPCSCRLCVYCCEADVRTWGLSHQAEEHRLRGQRACCVVRKWGVYVHHLAGLNGIMYKDAYHKHKLANGSTQSICQNLSRVCNGSVEVAMWLTSINKQTLSNGFCRLLKIFLIL